MGEFNPNQQIPTDPDLTPEMILAGVRAFDRWNSSDDGLAENLVTEIYQAMRSAREGC